MGVKNMVLHDFYCINCGKKAYSLFRKKSALKLKFHRKKMSCPCCGATINMIECRNAEEVREFKELFETGKFKEEAVESIKICQEGIF